MTPLDWTVLALYFAVLLGIGLWPSRRAGKGEEDYFVSGRGLTWWMAGTSLIAASFASDTPLLVSGLVRSKGLWGNWLWLGFGISAVLTVFLFAPLWRSAGVVTDVELTELRYSGFGGSFLRGFKAIYWGVLFNCFTAGAWAVTGLVKVTAAATGLGKSESIILCAGIGTVYAVASGLWGLVLTDMFQFAMAIIGALLVAWFAVGAAGGWSAVLEAVPPGQLEILPLEGPGWAFALPFLAIQWWAWKNTDGSGVMVQRWAACKNERHAMGATLWYAVVHYGVRCWPWAAVGLASIVLIPDAMLPRLSDGSPDHESAYPLVIARVIPAGVRGFVLAWFFAEFMSAIAQSMSWGASVLVNDVYRRFIAPGCTSEQAVRLGRGASLLIMAGAVTTAFFTDDIATAFGYVITGTAAVGIIAILRWLWWRPNAWSEFAAMVLSPLITFVFAKPYLAEWGIPSTPMSRTLVVILGAAVPAILIAYVTPPNDRERLKAFYRRVRPPGPGWGPIARECPEVTPAISLRRVGVCWLLGCGLVYGTMWGIGTGLFGSPLVAVSAFAIAAACGALLWWIVRGADPTSASPPLPAGLVRHASGG